MLAWSMLSFGGGYNSSGTDLWAKGQATLKWNTDYLLKTIKDDPASSALSTKPEFFIVYQVCGCLTDVHVWYSAPCMSWCETCHICVYAVSAFSCLVLSVGVL